MIDRREWIPDEAIEALLVRRATAADEDPIRLAADILTENLPIATAAMVHLAVHSPTEAIRFQASKYVMDRSFGEAKGLPTSGNKPAWERIYDTVLDEAENITKNG